MNNIKSVDDLDFDFSEVFGQTSKIPDENLEVEGYFGDNLIEIQKNIDFGNVGILEDVGSVFETNRYKDDRGFRYNMFIPKNKVQERGR